MNVFVRWTYVSALFVLALGLTTNSFAGDRSIKLSSGDNTETYESSRETQFSWTPERRLKWGDFRGPVLAGVHDITAAATFCGIGFETNDLNEAGELRIKVYNTFYANRSWAKDDEKNENILAHEQGHFDLCELYTRILRERLSMVKKGTDVNALRNTLKHVYNEVQKEYAARQEQYETETQHGVVYEVQEHWQDVIAGELQQTEQWMENMLALKK